LEQPLAVFHRITLRFGSARRAEQDTHRPFKKVFPGAIEKPYIFEMQSVGHHLQKEAMILLPSASRDADEFARSSFNRYYYATFLCVRNCLIQIDEKWERNLAHKSVPELLRGEVKKRIKLVERKASAIGDKQLINSSKHIASLTLTLAATVENAYAVRVVADYNPGVSVDFEADRFKLSGTDVSDAHEWLPKAELWSKAVLNLLAQVNG
jgi:hypothetical protein